MQVLAFPDSIAPARALADALEAPLGLIEVHRFPDGESLVTIPDTVARTVIFFRSLHDPNAKLVELMLAIKTARQLGCKRVILVAPYLCYMRQDMAFKPGQAVSQRIIGEMLSEWVDDLLTVDPHLHRIQHLSEALPHCNSLAVSASQSLGDYLCQQSFQGLLVGPDEESAQWVEQVAQHANVDYIIARKQRFGDRDVRVSLPERELRGKDVMLVDDVISSGRTMIEAALALKAAGANRIGALCTHALFAPGALEDMNEAGINPIASTDSIAHATNQITLTGTLIEALHEFTGEPR